MFRELPLYFAHFGAVEAGYLDTLKGETPNADALRLFNKEIFETFDLRGELGHRRAGPAGLRLGRPRLDHVADDELRQGAGDPRVPGPGRLQRRHSLLDNDPVSCGP